MTRQTAKFLRAMLEGMTGAGLFHRLLYPGQADVFMGTETAEEVRSGPLYPSLVWAKTEEHASKAELAAYYPRSPRLCSRETDERTRHGACAAP